MDTQTAEEMLTGEVEAEGHTLDEWYDMIQRQIGRPGSDSSYQEIMKSLTGGFDEETAHEVAQAIREKILSRFDKSHRKIVEASYAWHRGETGDMTMDSEISFGQYEGMTVREMLDEDEDYASWVVSEMRENRTHLTVLLADAIDERRAESEGISVYLRRDDDYILEDDEDDNTHSTDTDTDMDTDKVTEGDTVKIEYSYKAPHPDDPHPENPSRFITKTEATEGEVVDAGEDRIKIHDSNRNRDVPYDRDEVVEVIERGEVEHEDFEFEAEGESYTAVWHPSDEQYTVEEASQYEVTADLSEDGFEVSSRLQVYKNVDDRVRDEVRTEMRAAADALRDALQ